jgi:hypothetical protein
MKRAKLTPAEEDLRTRLILHVLVIGVEALAQSTGVNRRHLERLLHEPDGLTSGWLRWLDKKLRQQQLVFVRPPMPSWPAPGGAA